MTHTPPDASPKDKELSIHGDTRLDPYYWLNDRENPEVIQYLEDENNYTKAVLKSTEKMQKQLFEEMKGRIKEDDSSVPYFLNEYWYIRRYEKGKDYPIFIRKHKTLDANEEILLDVNELAKDLSYCQVSGLSVSPDNTKLAYGIDTLSRRIYSIKVKDLIIGETLKDEIHGVSSYVAWTADSETFFYTSKDKETLRTDMIFRHKIGDTQADDAMVFEEKDETFYAFVYPSKSREYIMIGSTSTLTSEYQYLPSDKPTGKFKTIQKRQRGLEYSVAHFEDMFYISTNADNSTNFKLVKAPVASPSKKNWTDVLPHRDDVLLEGVELFRDFMVVSERIDGLLQLRVVKWDGSDDYYMDFESETYSSSLGTNVDFDAQTFRYNFTSLTTPSSVIDFNTFTKTKEVKKEQEVLGGTFDKSNYVAERLWATADDGTKIPISLVRHIDTALTPKTPLLQYGYGSYGNTIDPYFSSVRLSLLDRGFVFAIAHVRGGEYLGRTWYESGRKLSKKNTFTDFIACSRFLIDASFTSPSHLYAMGGSAGGLLMGAIMNMAPELYKGIVAAVPFVDVLTTMLDDSIPLTTGEYDEWGNPNDKKYYHYIKSYSPYDNVKPLAYPNTLVTTGLHDSQVQYWEPAKWVAKLRDVQQEDNLILLHTNMDAGHSGASGRFVSLKEIAMEYAFLLYLDKN
ncbi:MAG: oligopeptidase B [Flavobacteriaceae bacterium]|nr:oligopeptidase B [Flavobacteriaceae bacterium]|tara:strand:+ start:474 stop:2522 length:2049 start_codon:yes stop_codon:yes gene_type:complete